MWLRWLNDRAGVSFLCAGDNGPASELLLKPGGLIANVCPEIGTVVSPKYLERVQATRPVEYPGNQSFSLAQWPVCRYELRPDGQERCWPDNQVGLLRSYMLYKIACVYEEFIRDNMCSLICRGY